MLSQVDNYSNLTDDDPGAPWMQDPKLGGMQPSTRRRSWSASLDRDQPDTVMAPPAPLEMFSVAEFDDAQAPPKRRWLVPGRVPIPAHTLLSGDGAAGKTTILLQLCAATVLGTDWLGQPIEEQGPALFATGEEDRDEIHRRIGAIVAHTGGSFADLADFHCISRPGADMVLAATGKDGLVHPTALFQALEALVIRIKPKLIAIEAAADVFAGNENNRAEVRQFGQLMRRLTIAGDAALVLLQHPSVAGLAEGNGRSGSTHWRNSFRSQMNFAGLKSGKDGDDADASDLRVLTVGKSNYGRAGESVTVRWQSGVFVPEGSATSLDRMAADAEVDNLFIRLLEQCAAQGRDVSPSKSSTYAPSVMEGMATAGGVKARALSAAMERLLASGRVRVETFGPPSKRRQRLVKAN